MNHKVLTIAVLSLLSQGMRAQDSAPKELIAQEVNTQLTEVYCHSLENEFPFFRHEVGVHLGVGNREPFGTQHRDFANSMYDYYMMERMERRMKAVATLKAYYLCNINEWLGVGITFGVGFHGKYEYQRYNNSNSDRKGSYGYTEYANSTTTMFMAMPTVRFKWLRTRAISLYSRVAVGVAMNHSCFDPEDSDVRYRERERVTPNGPLLRSHSENEWRVAYQVTPIGIKFSPHRVQPFLELGYGYEGIFTTGISIALGRNCR